MAYKARQVTAKKTAKTQAVVSTLTRQLQMLRSQLACPNQNSASLASTDHSWSTKNCSWTEYAEGLWPRERPASNKWNLTDVQQLPSLITQVSATYIPSTAHITILKWINNAYAVALTICHRDH